MMMLLRHDGSVLISQALHRWRTVIKYSWFTCRSYEIGRIDYTQCHLYRTSGASARPPNTRSDTRITSRSLHNPIPSNRLFSTHSDSSDRSSTRINEMTESCKVIYPSLFTVINKVSFSSRNSSFSNYSITERIISNLLITYPPIIGVTNESKSSTESSKGTHPIYTNRYPYRITNTTSNDFLTIKQIENQRQLHYQLQA